MLKYISRYINDTFCSRFATKFEYARLISSTRATYPAYLNFLDLITLIISNKGHEL
jgi:hypothetical protein